MRLSRKAIPNDQGRLRAGSVFFVAMPWLVSMLMLLSTGCGDSDQNDDDGACQNRCTEGASACDGDGFRLCTIQSDGCTDWDELNPCPEGQVCSDGSCGPDCSDQCSEGATQCVRFEVQACKKQASGCLDWDAAAPCPEGEFCLVDKCIDGQGIAHWQKVYSTPDYLQTDTAYGGFPNDGEKHCVPVAVSNALMWLDDNGFDELAPNTDDRKKDQYDLIMLLASSSYMNTDLNGTSTEPTLLGLQKYLDEVGYTASEIKFQGFHTVDAQHDTGVEIPELDWIKQNLQGTTGVLLHAGWYTYEASTDTYTLTDGHLLTLVGYGFDENKVDPNYLVVHDPGNISGVEFANEHVLLEKLESGIMKINDWPRSAVGYYKMTGDMHVPAAPKQVAILGGATVLRME